MLDSVLSAQRSTFNARSHDYLASRSFQPTGRSHDFTDATVLRMLLDSLSAPQTLISSNFNRITAVTSARRAPASRTVFELYFVSGDFVKLCGVHPRAPRWENENGNCG